MKRPLIIRSLRLSACAAAIGVAALTSMPLAASADSPPKDASVHKDGTSMPAQPMDHSKMSGMNGMTGMEGMSMTGNADYDFAINMKMHHQKALDMAKMEVKDGKDPQMVKMAKSIVAAQTKEIAAFDKWLAANKQPN